MGRDISLFNSFFKTLGAMYMFLKYRPPHSSASIALLVYVHPETLEFYFKMREVLNAVGLLGMNTWMAARSHLPPDTSPCVLSDVKCPCDPRLVWNTRTRFVNMETTCVLLESLVRKSRGFRAGARHFRDWFVKYIVLGEGYWRCTDGTPMPRVIENQFRWKVADEDMVYVVELSDESTSSSLQEFGSELRAQHRQRHDQSVENLRPIECDRSPYRQDLRPPASPGLLPTPPPSPPPSPPVELPVPPPPRPVNGGPPVRSHVGPANMPVAPVRPLPMEPTLMDVSPEETTDAVYHLMEAAGTPETIVDMTFTAKTLKVEIANGRLNITVTDVDNFVL